MLSLREMSWGLYGAWRLLLRDRGAMAWFDRSLAGAIHSFWAAAICYPGFVVLLLVRLPASDVHSAAVFRILLVETIGYVIGWCAYPLAALPFCRWLAPEERALGFIIAYNWSQVLQTAALLPIAAAGGLDLAPAYVVAYADFVAYMAILVYEWIIARIALEAGALPATALVLLDVVIGAALSQVTQILSGQSPG
ncbi:MAG TPA: hypothetical protein VLV50_07860 [Stellaceae bacterium]|nr:hypothetical protein [Stellaceae bacterium]